MKEKAPSILTLKPWASESARGVSRCDSARARASYPTFITINTFLPKCQRSPRNGEKRPGIRWTRGSCWARIEFALSGTGGVVGRAISCHLIILPPNSLPLEIAHRGRVWAPSTWKKVTFSANHWFHDQVPSQASVMNDALFRR